MAGRQQQLFIWCKQLCSQRNVNITNLHTSWKDGRAFCALIDALQPGLIDMKTLSSKPEENLQLAFQTAQDKLQIPSLLDIEDLLIDKPDQFSIVTYLSQFALKYAPLAKDSTWNRSASSPALPRFEEKPTVVSSSSLTPREGASSNLKVLPRTFTSASQLRISNDNNDINKGSVSSLKCEKSGIVIPPDIEPIHWEGHIYHPEHFLCTKCSKVLNKKNQSLFLIYLIVKNVVPNY